MLDYTPETDKKYIVGLFDHRTCHMNLADHEYDATEKQVYKSIYDGVRYVLYKVGIDPNFVPYYMEIDENIASIDAEPIFSSIDPDAISLDLDDWKPVPRETMLRFKVDYNIENVETVPTFIRINILPGKLKEVERYFTTALIVKNDLGNTVPVFTRTEENHDVALFKSQKKAREEADEMIERHYFGMKVLLRMDLEVSKDLISGSDLTVSYSNAHHLLSECLIACAGKK